MRPRGGAEQPVLQGSRRDAILRRATAGNSRRDHARGQARRFGALLARRFKSTVRSLVGGLKATAEGGVGFRERAQDLLARLGPLDFLAK